MNPTIQFEKVNPKDKDDSLRFTLSGINVSLANAVRRTILSDIPTVVFKTSPNELNKSVFLVNTSRQNNEILKQRLSCIPIHINDLDMPLENYLLEVNIENLTDTIQYVTTKDFKVKNIQTGEFLKEQDNERIFPVNELGYYIDFARLRPKISDEIVGEKLHFTCEFSVATAKEDAMFNVVSNCTYGYTQDETLVESELAKKRVGWKEKDLDVEFEERNWRLLEAKRIVKKDSFDFIIQTVGVFTNEDLVKKACQILAKKLHVLNNDIDTDELKIEPSVNTMKNSYDITLVNEDYTIGKVIEYMLYAKFYEGLKLLTFSGFKKMHPHDSDSIVRIAYYEATEKDVIKQHLKQCFTEAAAIFDKIGDKF